MKPKMVKIGETFKIADIEFIKFTDGDEVVAVAKDAIFDSSFEINGNLSESNIKKRLETELLPKLEAAIGAENILEFETDMTALDGTKPFPNFRSKISLVTMDFYRQNRDMFGKYNLDKWWWLATPDSEEFKNVVLCVSPLGGIGFDGYFIDIGVRPILRFASSIFVSCEE